MYRPEANHPRAQADASVPWRARTDCKFYWTDEVVEFCPRTASLANKVQLAAIGAIRRNKA